MRSVLIVDDEYLQRELVKSTVSWEQLNLYIAGEAEDGREAVEKAKSIRPDIIIMDINIPFLNGIEVSRMVKEMDPDIQIIILTAYGEFEYAREALRFGAVNFLLKPLEPAELEKELLNACARIDDIRKQFFIESFAGVEGQKAKKIREKYGYDSDEKFCLFFVRFTDQQAVETYSRDIADLIEERFEKTEMIDMQTDRLFLTAGREGTEEFRFKVQAACACIGEEIGAGESFFGSTSDIHQGISQLHEAYREAYEGLADGRRLGKICAYESRSVSECIGRIPYRAHDFRFLLRSKKYGEAQKQIEDCFDSFASGDVPRQVISYITTDILVNFFMHLVETGEDIEEENKREKQILTELEHQTDIRKIRELVIGLLKSGISRMGERLVPSGKKKVEEAKKYIDKNYWQNDLSLNLVAEKTEVNPSYLSSIFKKEYGYSLSRYLIMVRMEKARQMMEEAPNLTVASAAELSGYSDAYYFSRSFKQQYGMSPSAYLEKLKCR